ncbi:hypothetical protein SADUNF_Sadunf19G0026400 [Salix dunnii]|uniref:Leucine-rich repeat-containing N-terminal plant-type domain-containing protein n=1 Tax=Salix dunnii TaxID=1413687 RepID=A0A835J1L6_9ROSI|nr:hypothetical protein SADUNF_Sadunf19G0026400 [Salix dunnii]
MKFLCLDLKWKTQKKTKQQPLGSPLYFVKNERGDERFSKQTAKLDNLSSYANNRSVEKESPKKKPTECGEMKSEVLVLNARLPYLIFNMICVHPEETSQTKGVKNSRQGYSRLQIETISDNSLGKKTIPSTHSSILESWNSSSDCCQWKYLTFTSVTSSVLTPLFRLHAHLSLSFSLNHIQGEISRDGLANLTKLVHLDLADTSLDYMYSSENSLTGDIPISLGSLLNEPIHIFHTNPKHRSQRQKSQYLILQSLSRINFLGQFPDNIDEAPRFYEYLSCETTISVGQYLSPSIIYCTWKCWIYQPTDFPATSFQILIKIHHWFMLIYPPIDFLKLSGKIPSSLGNLNGTYKNHELDTMLLIWLADYEEFQELEVIWKKFKQYQSIHSIHLCSLFDLSDNHHKRISGRISTSFGDKRSVESLDLSHNILTGEIPGTFANLPEPRT